MNIAASPDLIKFFEVDHNFAVLKAINGSAPPISLRALAWFDSNGMEDESMRTDYQKQLKLHTRQRFDPFRRLCSGVHHMKKGTDQIATTVGQMNFFKWMIERGLWEFVVQNRSRVAVDIARRTNTSSRPASTKGAASVVGTGFSQLSGRHVVVFD